MLLSPLVPNSLPGARVSGGLLSLALPPQLPDKVIPSLVKYYYSWKKTRSRTSVMDRQARRLGGRKDKEDRWGWGLLLFGWASGSETQTIQMHFLFPLIAFVKSLYIP